MFMNKILERHHQLHFPNQLYVVLQTKHLLKPHLLWENYQINLCHKVIEWLSLQLSELKLLLQFVCCIVI